MYCSKCGEKNNQGSKYCVKCGNPISEAQSEPAQENTAKESADFICSNCGKRVPESLSFCTNCGASTEHSILELIGNSQTSNQSESCFASNESRTESRPLGNLPATNSNINYQSASSDQSRNSQSEGNNFVPEKKKKVWIPISAVALAMVLIGGALWQFTDILPFGRPPWDRKNESEQLYIAWQNDVSDERKIEDAEEDESAKGEGEDEGEREGEGDVGRDADGEEEAPGESSALPTNSNAQLLAAALREFISDAEWRTYACLVDINGDGVPEMFAVKEDKKEDIMSSPSLTKCFFYICDGNIKTYEQKGVGYANSGMFISATNHLISHWGSQGAPDEYVVFSLESGELMPNTAYLKWDYFAWDYSTSNYTDAYYYNDAEITENEYYSYLEQYGIAYGPHDNNLSNSTYSWMWCYYVSVPDQTIEILAMTAQLPSPMPTPSPTPDPSPAPDSTPAVNERDYILPHSNTRALTDDDLRGLTDDELKLARNEIYARHGRVFRDSMLQDYFDSKPWYQNLQKLPLGTEPTLSRLELSNALFIQAYEAGQ